MGQAALDSRSLCWGTTPCAQTRATISFRNTTAPPGQNSNIFAKHQDAGASLPEKIRRHSPVASIQSLVRRDVANVPTESRLSATESLKT